MLKQKGWINDEINYQTIDECRKMSLNSIKKLQNTINYINNQKQKEKTKSKKKKSSKTKSKKRKSSKTKYKQLKKKRKR